MDDLWEQRQSALNKSELTIAEASLAEEEAKVQAKRREVKGMLIGPEKPDPGPNPRPNPRLNPRLNPNYDLMVPGPEKEAGKVELAEAEAHLSARRESVQELRNKVSSAKRQSLQKEDYVRGTESAWETSTRRESSEDQSQEA